MLKVFLGAAASVFFAAMAFVSDGWAVFWFLLLLVGAMAETYALYREEKNDTFSESVWRKTTKPWQRWLLGLFMFWLTFHFLFQNPSSKP
jgi:hypothetical protein